MTSGLNWIDLLIAVWVVWTVFKGYRKGLVREVFSLGGAVLAVILAYANYRNLGAYLSARFAMPGQLAAVVSFAVILLAVGLLASLVGRIWAAGISKLSSLSLLDSVGGAGFGFVKAVLVAMVVLVLVINLPFEFSIRSIQESTVAAGLLFAAPRIYEALDDLIPGDLPSWDRWDRMPALPSPFEKRRGRGPDLPDLGPGVGDPI